MAMIVIIVAIAPVMIRVMVTPVIMVVPVRMVSIVIVIIVGCPRIPVPWIITIIPGGSPHYVSRMVHKPDKWPYCDFIIIGTNDLVTTYIPCISRIGCFGIERLNNIIGSVKGLISYQLNLHLPVAKLLHYKNSDVLLVLVVQCRT
jgi:hypothetical protein